MSLIKSIFLIAGCSLVFIFLAIKYVNAFNPQKDEPKLQIPARVVSVYDGDTVTIEFKIRVNVRLLDCWAPEIKTKDKEEKDKGLESKKYLENLLKVDDEVIAEIPFDGNISNSISLSRILATIYKDIDGDGVKDNISSIMVDKGYAKETKEK